MILRSIELKIPLWYTLLWWNVIRLWRKRSYNVFREAELRGGCSSTVERQVVDLEVAGAAPVSHPFDSRCSLMAIASRRKRVTLKG